MEVTALDPYEFNLAGEVGLWRWRAAILENRKERMTHPGRAWIDQAADHILGVAGELGYCKRFGIYYRPTVGTYQKEPDVTHAGSPLEIKTVRKPHYGLLVPENDPEDRWYVLMSGGGPDLALIGRMHGSDVKRYPLSDPGNYGKPCRLIPRADLTPPAR